MAISGEKNSEKKSLFLVQDGNFFSAKSSSWLQLDTWISQ